MYKNIFLTVLLLFHSVWSISINGTKESPGSWFLRFCHIPELENIGAFKMHIQFSDNMDISQISTDAPRTGAWSQITPKLRTLENSVEVFCLNPALANSHITDTTEMFNLSFEFSAGQDADSHFDAIVDSIWFTECIDTRGNETTPLFNLTTGLLSSSAGKRGKSQQITHRSNGRVHSLSFNLGEKQKITARVVDVRGRIITRLASRQFTPGLHTVRWPVNNQSIATGTYFMQLEINNYTYSKKVRYFK